MTMNLAYPEAESTAPTSEWLNSGDEEETDLTKILMDARM